jgi:hypothetical protein
MLYSIIGSLAMIKRVVMAAAAIFVGVAESRYELCTRLILTGASPPHRNTMVFKIIN